MAIPDYQSLMLPVLKASAPGEVRLASVVDELAESLGLTPEERSQLLPSGKHATFTNRVNWAKFSLSKACVIENTRRGYFRITPRGQKLLESNPERVDDKLLMQFEEFRQFREGSGASDERLVVPAVDIGGEQTQTPDEQIRRANAQINTALAQELLDRVREAPPVFFEDLIVKLLLSMGYGSSKDEAGRSLGRSGDDGVDGVIDQDALGLDQIYVQAKRYAEGNSVGSGAIRDFFGSLDHHKAAKGIFVTTSTFSASALRTAETLSKRIILIDGNRLARLMIRYDVGCRVDEHFDIKKVDEGFFE